MWAARAAGDMDLNVRVFVSFHLADFDQAIDPFFGGCELEALSAVVHV